MTIFTEYTADQIETAAQSALEARDMPAVVSLLHVLAVKAPDRAQSWLDVIQLATANPTEMEQT